MAKQATTAKAQPVTALLADKIAKAIKDKSVVDERGRLPAERKLAEMMGASRTSVREALQHLNAEGVLELGHRARARVRANASPRSSMAQLGAAARELMNAHGGIEEFQEARALFECGLARHAARHATPKQISKLTEAFLENKQAVGQLERFIDTDRRFHQVLAEIPGNPIFVVINAALSDWLTDQRRLGLQWKNSDEQASHGHQEILDAIIARDPDAAETAVANHLLNVSGYYLKAKVLKLTGS